MIGFDFDNLKSFKTIFHIIKIEILLYLHVISNYYESAATSIF